MATKRRTPQQRRIEALSSRTAELEMALTTTTAVAEERKERIEALLDYFDVRFAEWGNERRAMERTITNMHKSVRGYERRIAHIEVGAEINGGIG